MKFVKAKINMILMIGLVIVTVLFTLFITKNKDIPVIAEKTIVDVKVIEENLRSVAELATLTYNYSDVGMFSEQKSFSMFGNDIKLLGTKKSFILTYDGEMKFGIDLSQITVSENNNILSITIPPAQMFSHEMKEDSVHLLDEKTGLFTSFSMSDYTEFMAEQKVKMENKAVEKDLYSQAHANAKAQIKSFVSSVPGVSEKYDIQFVDTYE